MCITRYKLKFALKIIIMSNMIKAILPLQQISRPFGFIQFYYCIDTCFCEIYSRKGRFVLQNRTLQNTLCFSSAGNQGLCYYCQNIPNQFYFTTF